MTNAKPPAVLYTSILQHPQARALIESAAVLLAKAEKFQEIPSDADAEVVAEFRGRLNQTIKDLDTQRLAATEEHRKLVAKINGEANEKLTPMGEVLTRVDKLLKAYREKKAAEHVAALRKQQEEEARLERERQEAEAKAREAQEAAQKAAADIAAAQQLATFATTPEAKEAAQETLAQAQAAQQAAISTVAQASSQAIQLEQQQEVVAHALVLPSAPPRSIRGIHGSTTSQRDNWKWELIDTEAQPAAESIKLVPPEYLVEPVDRLNKSVLNAKAKSVKKESTTAVPGIRIYNDPIESSRTGR